MRMLCFMSLGLFFALIASPLMATPAQKDAASSQSSLATGQRLFLDNCAECHQRNGRGIEGIYPSLASSEVVRGGGVDVALQLIIGRGEMPSFASAMGAEEMADLINYVRNAWGNEGDSIDAATIERLIK